MRNSSTDDSPVPIPSKMISPFLRLGHGRQGNGFVFPREK